MVAAVAQTCRAFSSSVPELSKSQERKRASCFCLSGDVGDVPLNWPVGGSSYINFISFIFISSQIVLYHLQSSSTTIYSCKGWKARKTLLPDFFDQLWVHVVSHVSPVFFHDRQDSAAHVEGQAVHLNSSDILQGIARYWKLQFQNDFSNLHPSSASLANGTVPLGFHGNCLTSAGHV